MNCRFAIPVLGILVCSTSYICGDEAGPPVRPSRVYNEGMVIEVNEQRDLPLILIPRNVASEEVIAGAKRGMTVVAGGCLAFGVIAAGVWLVRRNARRGAAGAALAILALVTLGGVVWANGAYPRFLKPNQVAVGEVCIQLGGERGNVTLIANKDTLRQLREQIDKAIALPVPSEPAASATANP